MNIGKTRVLMDNVNEENNECTNNICLPILFRILTITEDTMAQFLMKSGGTPKEQARRRTEVCKACLNVTF